MKDELLAKLAAQKIETPSWGYGNSGTRFKTFAWPGAARDVWEKIEDAALIHQLSGIAPSVALHIPWDKVDDYAQLRQYAEAKGIRLGAINPNLFQDDAYRLGSLGHPDQAVRDKALKHLLECIDIMHQTGSSLLSLWFADGTNYAGQDDFTARKARFEQGLQQVYAALPADSRLLLEYKPFEPAFYHTDLADWGMAYAHCLKLGERAQVLVDLGHHLPGTNIEQIVAFLLAEGRLGGFHFNNRRYADDDLIVGSSNPLELFCIYAEIVKNHSRFARDKADQPGAPEIAFMIDQSHNLEPKLEAMLQSVLNCQEAYAKALHIDLAALTAAQGAGDALAAHRIYQDAFATDVRPLLRELRRAMGVPADPIKALREGGYQEQRAAQRGTQEAGGGYPSS
ncbi:MAG: L-rhamnose isomerase [Truepera sp.]|nr:L-rhamnose isomerase [Truepera sp.]